MPSFGTSLTLPLADTSFSANTVWVPSMRSGNLFTYREANTSSGYNLAYKQLASSLAVQVFPASGNQPLHKVRMKIVQPFCQRASDGLTAMPFSKDYGSIELLAMAPQGAWVTELNILNKLLYAFIKTYGLSYVDALVRNQEGMMA